jgi:hypothetical protein
MTNARDSGRGSRHRRLPGLGPRVAILDDYQGVALRLADWSILPADITCSATISIEASVAARLADFDVVVAMRSDTFSAHADRAPTALQALGDLGMRNAVIDLRAAADRGVVVSGTSGLPPRGRADVGAHPRARAARARQLRPGSNGGALSPVSPLRTRAHREPSGRVECCPFR